MKEDLGSLLRNEKEKLSWEERMSMSIDIARGMTYLHNLIPIMIHRGSISNNSSYSGRFEKHKLFSG